MLETWNIKNITSPTWKATALNNLSVIQTRNCEYENNLFRHETGRKSKAYGRSCHLEKHALLCCSISSFPSFGGSSRRWKLSTDGRASVLEKTRRRLHSCKEKTSRSWSRAIALTLLTPQGHAAELIGTWSIRR